MTRWRTEESLGCMTTWSQDRILSWAPPFGKREDSCKPPQGERLYPCAWFQVQDPSAVRLDLAHVSLVSANDILRIRRVSTLVSPTVELSTPRKPTGRVTPMRQAKQCKNSYNGAYDSNLRATVIPS